MKKWYGGVLIASLFMLLLLRYDLLKIPLGQSYVTSAVASISSNPLKWLQALPPAIQNPDDASQVIPIDTIASTLYAQRNISKEKRQSLQTWNLLKHLITHSMVLPNGVEAIMEAGNVWNNLMLSVEEEENGYTNKSSAIREKEKQCPHFLNKMNASNLVNSSFRLQVPCGLTQGSSITIIGIPNGLLGNFRIDLTGEPLPGEPDPPIILHYNVRLHGDKITENPVIVQNTWTSNNDLSEEERCPSTSPEKIIKVDELDQCNKLVGKDDKRLSMTSNHWNSSRRSSVAQERSKTRTYFPFKQGSPFVGTFRGGSEGIQMTVDGKHVTSFVYRETLEPWLVNEVRISGDLKLISTLASGLPISEDSEYTIDLEALKSFPLSHHQSVDLFIGVFSTANNFKRRMAVRRTWMQYPAVRSRAVAVRFFVGSHKNQRVIGELWKEAQTYGDIRLMPFVDYYNLITWKTLAICIFGVKSCLYLVEEDCSLSLLTSFPQHTQVVSAKFVMKRDDDAFVCVDEVLVSLNRINVNSGLLYGLINDHSRPHRNVDSKWYISPQVVLYSGIYPLENKP